MELVGKKLNFMKRLLPIYYSTKTAAMTPNSLFSISCLLSQLSSVFFFLLCISSFLSLWWKEYFFIERVRGVGFRRMIIMIKVASWDSSHEFLVSKETVVLSRWERWKQKFGFIKRVDKGWNTTVKDVESWRFER